MAGRFIMASEVHRKYGADPWMSLFNASSNRTDADLADVFNASSLSNRAAIVELLTALLMNVTVHGNLSLLHVLADDGIGGDGNGSAIAAIDRRPIELRFDDGDDDDVALSSLSSSSSPALDSAVPITIVFSLIFVTGLIGNACTCAVIVRNRHMRTATNYYLFSLAVSDLLLLLLGLPQEIYQVWRPSPFLFGESFCVFRGLAAETSTNASILTITAFTMERYVAICHPLRSHTMSKLSRAIKLILIIWLIAAVCAVPTAIQFGIVYQYYDGELIPDSSECIVKNRLEYAFELSTLFFFGLPMTLISVLYLFIAVRLRRSGITSGSSGNIDDGVADGGGSAAVVALPLRANTIKVSRSPRTCRHQQNGSSSRQAVIKMLGNSVSPNSTTGTSTPASNESGPPSFMKTIENGLKSAFVQHIEGAVEGAVEDVVENGIQTLL